MLGKTRDPTDPPRCRATNQQGHGPAAHDRPPIMQVICRETGEIRRWVIDTTDQETCHAVLRTLLPLEAILYSEEWSGYTGWPAHETVCHSQREWARDADGNGHRAVHSHTCEGAGAGLRTFLRRFRGVHKAFLACYLDVSEAIVHAKHITDGLVQRICFRPHVHTKLR